MPRPALFALASPQRLEAMVDRAMEGSISLSGEPKKERVKAWVSLATGKVAISGKDAGEVMHVVSLCRVRLSTCFSSSLSGAADQAVKAAIISPGGRRRMHVFCPKQWVYLGM